MVVCKPGEIPSLSASTWSITSLIHDFILSMPDQSSFWRFASAHKCWAHFRKNQVFIFHSDTILFQTMTGLNLSRSVPEIRKWTFLIFLGKVIKPFSLVVPDLTDLMLHHLSQVWSMVVCKPGEIPSLSACTWNYTSLIHNFILSMPDQNSF